MSICNPCSCLTGQITMMPATPCPADKSDCCLKACNGLITCENGGVGPCGQSGVMNLNDLLHHTSGCEGELVFRKGKEDFFDKNIFASVTIKPDGELKWVTNGPEVAGKYGQICFKVLCLSNCEDCTELRANGTVTIGVKDMCLVNTCEECETCNPCTGVCEETDAMVSVGTLDQNSNIIANG